MITEKEALARIAALPVHRIDPDALGWISAEQVAEVLAEVRPTPPHGTDRAALRKAVQPVLWNASNYPRKAQPHILGQDITPLVDQVTDAVFALVGSNK